MNSVCKAPSTSAVLLGSDQVVHACPTLRAVARLLLSERCCCCRCIIPSSSELLFHTSSDEKPAARLDWIQRVTGGQWTRPDFDLTRFTSLRLVPTDPGSGEGDPFLPIVVNITRMTITALSGLQLQWLT